MSDDYLWDRSGIPDPDIRSLEELLGPLEHTAPLDERRLAKSEQPARATAREPVTATSSRRRSKGNMQIFDKRVIGLATLSGAALALLGVGAYMHFSPAHHEEGVWVPLRGDPRVAALTHPIAGKPVAAPIEPTAGGDVAITAGENARIHVPFGTLDLEIRSECAADVELTIATAGGLQHASSQDRESPVQFVPLATSESRAPGGDPVVPGTPNSDGSVTTYHLVPDVRDLGLYQYTARCRGRAPTQGVIAIDRGDASAPIPAISNARIYSKGAVQRGALARGLHVTGNVLPGARVSTGSRIIPLQPADPGAGDLPVGATFSTDIPMTPQHVVAAVRVDDPTGTHFYVMHPTVVIDACADTIDAPKAAAAKLDAGGDHAAAAKTLEAAIASCTPDRTILGLAFTYACRAGDAPAAKRYWRKLPSELQGSLAAECERNGIPKVALDKAD